MNTGKCQISIQIDLALVRTVLICNYRPSAPEMTNGRTMIIDIIVSRERERGSQLCPKSVPFILRQWHLAAVSVVKITSFSFYSVDYLKDRFE